MKTKSCSKSNNLNVQKGGSGITSSSRPKETKRARKRREWMERLSRREQGMTDPGRRHQQYRGDWAYLPDLVLEEIFQYLGYKVSNKKYLLSVKKFICKSSKRKLFNSEVIWRNVPNWKFGIFLGLRGRYSSSSDPHKITASLQFRF